MTREPTATTSGERDLAVLLASVDPHLQEGEWVFVTTSDPAGPAAVDARATVVEAEGTSVVLRRARADELGLTYDMVGAWITLGVHSALDAVGLTAAVATALAVAGISCNVLAGRHHDHLVVPHDRGVEAVELLRSLGSGRDAVVRAGDAGRTELPTVVLPAVTVDQMREVDRVMVEGLGIELLQMMENAGRALAELAVLRYRPRTCAVLAGAGSNGGGGLVAARHLHNRGVQVHVAPAESEPAGVTGAQLGILRRMGVAVGGDEATAESDLVIDAAIGHGLHGPPRGRPAGLVRRVAAARAPVLALDVPSGLDATTGEVHHPCVRADATLALALPTTGLLAAPQTTGALHAADIGVPPSVYDRFGLDVRGVFAAGPLVRVRV